MREKGRREGKSDKAEEERVERFGAMLSESVFCSGKWVDLGGGSSSREMKPILTVHFLHHRSETHTNRLKPH